jgi:hypothetical protein
MREQELSGGRFEEAAKAINMFLWRVSNIVYVYVINNNVHIS